MGAFTWLINIFNKSEERAEAQVPNEDYAIVNLLESYSIEESELELDKIQSISEGIVSYVDALIKDVAKITKIKDEAELAFVFTKVKKVSENALELNNLLEQLVSYYYDPIIKILEQVNEKKGVALFLEVMNRSKSNIDKLTQLLNSFIVYDDLLNPEKRVIEEIGKEFENKKFKDDFVKSLVEVRELIDQIILSPDLKHSLNLKILDTVKDEVFN